jgi:phage head maturation protease
MMALTAAIAVSVKTGREIVPGWLPDGPGEVTVFAYAGLWVDWKSLVVHICGAAQIAVPMIDFQFVSDPIMHRKPANLDPDYAAYWAPYREADDAATRALYNPSNRLFVVFGLGEVIVHGSDGAMLQLYRFFEGITTLMAGCPTAFHEDSWGDGETWAGDFGPVFRLPQLCDSTSGVSELLSRLAGADLREDRPENSTVGGGARSTPRPGGVTAEAFFAMEPDEVLLAILDDGRSPESQRIKAKARAQGIGPRRLWKAAKRLEAAFGGRGSDSQGTPLRETTYSSPGTLHGYLAVFNIWTEVDRPPEGNFLQRLAPGCFAKTIRESRHRMKVNFMHGWNPQLGDKPLGPIEDVGEDSIGVYYTVPLSDTADNWKLAAGLGAGLYGSSYRLVVMAEDFDPKPGRSAWNPRGLPERTILEARLPDFGPVASPLYPSTSAGVLPR